MALLQRKTRRPAEAPAAEGQQTPPPGTYTSQAFALWDEQSRPEGKRHVLELGSAHTSSIEFFGADPCRLQILGLDSVLPIDVGPLDEDEDPSDREVEALREQLPGVAPQSQHGALCWDLPNYLTHAQLRMLGEWMHEVLVVDGVVHLGLYTGSSMPALPPRYGVQDASIIHRAPRDAREVTCPRYSQKDLQNDWPDFEVVRSFLLRSEIQEFVLRRL